jgi:hypothetical protein
MDPVILARLQFTITCVYHFFFVPLTLGLSILQFRHGFGHRHCDGIPIRDELV